MEDGEIDMQDDDTHRHRAERGHRLRVPSPPSPVRDPLLPQRKAKKIKPSKAGYVDVYGEQARAQIQLHNTGPIKALDVQGLVLWVLADGVNPRWCFVKNKAMISQVMMVAIPGLEPELFNAKKEMMPVLHSQLGTPVTVLAKNASVRSGSTLSTLFTVPFSKKRKREYDQEHKQGGTKTNPFPAIHYAVTLKQMQANLYPLPWVDHDGSLRCPDKFVATQPAGDKVFPEMVSVDCEMCITDAGYELTRASLVDGKGQVLLDELVKPTNMITDYNTQYSGITPQALANVTTTLADIQERLCELVAAETLLVGHGLENDLMALKLLHANCLDTAIIFPHPKGPPFKPALRVLAERYLKRTIQQGEHDSVIDARAAMDLVQLKLAKGPAFGSFNSEEHGDKLMDILHANRRRCCLIDRHDMLNRHVTAGASAIVAFSDADAVHKACKEISHESVHFVWAQLRGLGTFLGARAQHKKEAAAPGPQASGPADAQMNAPTDAATAARASERLQNGNASDLATGQQQQQEVNGAPQPMQTDAADPGADKALQNPSAASPEPGKSPAVAVPSPEVSAGTNSRMALPQASSAAAQQAAPEPVNSVAQEHQQVECSIQEEVHHHEEVREVAEGDNSQTGKRKREPDTESKIVHQHSMTVTKRRKVVDEKQKVKSLAAPAFAVTSEAKPDAAAEADNTQQDALEGAAASTAEKVNDTDAAQQEPSASTQYHQDASNFTEDKLDDVLRGLDHSVAQLLEAMPVNGLMMVFTCQGDTAEYRRLQERKFRQQARLDALPAWTVDDEAAIAKMGSRVSRALCFASVKT